MGNLDARVWAPGLVWGAAVYGFHKYGALAGLYVTFPWFQNLTHAASASGVAILVGLMGLEFGVRGRRLVGFVVLGTALAATGWEAIEYLGWLDQYGVYLMFHDLNDAAVDMLSNGVGVLLAISVLRWGTGLARSGADSPGPSGRGEADGRPASDASGTSSGD